MNILIVDDETIIREWLQMSLLATSPKVKSVVTAIDGLDALEKLKSSLFDAIFIDIQMPRMDGLTLMKEIRKEHPTVPIIILSSHTQFDYAREVMRLGALEYLLKTECNKDLLNRIIEKVDQQQSSIPDKSSSSISRANFLRSVLAGKIDDSTHPFLEYDGKLYFTFATRHIETPLSLPSEFKDSAILHFIGSQNNIAYYFAIISSTNDLECGEHIRDNLLSTLILNQNITIGSSKLFISIAHITTSISTAEIALQQLFYTPENLCIYRLEFGTKNEQNSKDKLLDITSDIVKYIRNYNNSFIISSITNLNIFVVKNKPNNTAFVKDTYYNILNALYMHYYSDDSKLIMILDDVKNRINQCNKISELIEFTTQSINQDILLLSPNTEYSTHIKSALLYIAEQYDSISSVREIADSIHLNFDYFTRLFKKEVGENINTFLRNYRLNMAALMLKTTLFPVSDIALRVGMGNISYFSKTFKELYGMQPNAYRNLFRE